MIEEKLEAKHAVTVREARQALLSHPRLRFAEHGHTAGEDVYVTFGQTFGGRYLSIFVYKQAAATAVIISARDMTQKERRAYGRK